MLRIQSPLSLGERTVREKGVITSWEGKKMRKNRRNSHSVDVEVGGLDLPPRIRHVPQDPAEGQDSQGHQLLTILSSMFHLENES